MAVVGFCQAPQLDNRPGIGAAHAECLKPLPIVDEAEGCRLPMCGGFWGLHCA